MKYICAQPRLVYYAWQLEVMLNNFTKHNINPLDIQILVAYSSDVNDKTNDQIVLKSFEKLKNKFNTVSFFYYEDSRINPQYISSIRPNILKQHFKLYPELKGDTFFYHDCDIVFTKTPDFSKFLNDDTWYMSDTSSYIGYSYIVSKGEDIYLKMCDIIGINKEIPRLMEPSSGGAQYIMKNVDYIFWEKVEIDSEKLYSFFLEDENNKIGINYHPIQKWTSDMWSLLWNAWLFCNNTRVDSYLDFTWATDSIEEWNKNLIYHNAGVVGPGELFYKGDYINELPYKEKLILNPNYASYNYYKEILETKINTCLI